MCYHYVEVCGGYLHFRIFMPAMIKRNSVKQEQDLITQLERPRGEERCRAYLESIRWPDGATCPRCSSMNIARVRGRGQFDCSSCRYQFSVTSNTIFHHSHLPLWKWFATVYFMTESRNGISANQIKDIIGVSYKTAWYLCHRVRAAMSGAKLHPSNQVIEIDETSISRGRKGFEHVYEDNKSIVVGAKERGGGPGLLVVDKTGRKTLHEFIYAANDTDTEAIYTDEWPAYRGIADHDTRHETVNHSAEEWVNGDVHTNTVENVWSLLKRSIVGSYHKVSTKHLDSYLDELEWRFNNRDNPYLFRDTLLKLIKSENLTYQKLTTNQV